MKITVMHAGRVSHTNKAKIREYMNDGMLCHMSGATMLLTSLLVCVHTYKHRLYAWTG